VEILKELMMSSINWGHLIDPNDIDRSLLTWDQYFMDVIGSCIPKGVLPRRKNVP